MCPYVFGRATARPYIVFSPRTHSMRPYVFGRTQCVHTPFRGLGGWAWFILQEQGGRDKRRSGRSPPYTRSPG